MIIADCGFGIAECVLGCFFKFSFYTAFQDVKASSRLMGEDEKGTIRTLNAYKEVMTSLIQHHRGRVVDAAGDNVFAEFARVVDAVE